MRLSLVLALALLFLLLSSLHEVDAKKRKGRKPSKPSKARSPSRSSSRKPNYRKPKVVKPRIYKDTFIPTKSYSSPVILKQTRYKSKSSKYPKYLAAGAAGAVVLYALSNAPVYRGYYPMYGSRLHMPYNRGMRVFEERQEIYNTYTNEKCYQVRTETVQAPATTTDTDTDKKLESPQSSATTVTYDGGEKQAAGENGTITLDENQIDKNFTAVTVTEYAEPIPNTKITENCTRVVTTTRASMIRVYENNPNANAAFVESTSSLLLVLALAILSFKMLR